jgi:hypothetical protein
MSDAGHGKPEKPGFFTASVAAWDAWRRSYVFRRELLGWPKVRRMAPGHFVMRAPHMGPRRMQQYGGWKPPVFTGVALGLLVALRPGTEPGAFWPIWIFMGAIIGFLSIPFWHWMQRTRLKIHFTDGAISWRGPDRRKYGYRPGEWRDVVTGPHRLADEEARQHRNFMAANPRGQHPEPIFQILSELVMQTGLAGTVFVPVAEFYNDLSEEQAGRLRAAIVFVFKEALEELEARERTA